MAYDLFISYAHQGDNTSREAVAALVARLHAELESDFRRRFNRDLEIFFDKEDIQDFDHWQVRCHRALRDSRFFIACLSRTYLRSDACRWEWEEWCRHELEHGLVGQGAASLWFVKLEDLDAPEDAALLRRWKGDLLQRFHIQCHEWRHDDHGNFLDAAARSELQQLTEHVAQRLRLLTLDRARRGNLPWPNANFVGREPELASLRAALLDAPEQSPAGIHGVGGMGKTALAQAFAYKEADAFPGGWWLLRCEGRDRLLTVFRTLVNDLEIELTDEEKLDDAKAVRRVFDVLRARGPALFLLDNVDHPVLLAQEQMKLLADQPWARVLYTTRLAPDEFARAGAMIRPLDLDRLPENQAVDLIRRYQPGQAFASPEHEAAAREIVRELSGLTLAVETAAVYLGQCDPRVAEPQYAVDVRNYLTKLRDDLKTGGSEGVMNQLREVTATLRPTLARLDAPARTVLQIASLLSPDGVALPWVRAIAGQSHPELATDAATGESDPWTQLIRDLIGMRLFQPTAEPRVVAIHRILQRVLESELPERRKQYEARLEAHLEERNAALQKETRWQETRWELEPFGALATLWTDNNHPSAFWLLNQAGLRWYDLAEWTRAEPLLRRALAIDENCFGPNHPTVAAALNNLAQLLLATNRLTEAEPMYRRALAISENSYGHGHPKVSIALNNLALLLRQTNRVPEAEPLLRRALAIDEASFGPNHQEVAADLNNLALLLCQTNRVPEAEQLLRRALAIAQVNYGPDHPKTATSFTNLGNVLYELNHLVEAESWMRRALAIDEACFGPKHPGVATDLNNLALLLEESNQLDEAELLMRRALSMVEEIYGPEHPTVATTLNNLGGLLRATDRRAAVEPMYRRALAIHETSFGPDHPEVATDLNNLALLFIETERNNEAIPLIERSLKINEIAFGPYHPVTATSMACLAGAYKDNNCLAEAESLMRRVIQIFENSLGENHPKLATMLDNLAELLQATNRLAEAEPLMRRALAIYEQSFSPNHPKITTSLNNLAAVLRAANRRAEAEPLLRRVIDIFEKNDPEKQPNYVSSINNLATLLLEMNRLEEAELLMGGAVEILLKMTQATRHPLPHLRTFLINYARLLQAMGQPPNEVLAQLNAVARSFGMSIGGDNK
jgi:tetratricopeptide (TPR) repeat protein